MAGQYFSLQRSTTKVSFPGLLWSLSFACLIVSSTDAGTFLSRVLCRGVVRIRNANTKVKTSVSKTKLSFFFFTAFILFSKFQVDESDRKGERQGGVAMKEAAFQMTIHRRKDGIEKNDTLQSATVICGSPYPP